MQYKTVLSIAGSDSCGGAGIQADIKTCTALGCYAMTAITAVTVQSTTGVEGYDAMDPQLIADQIRCVCTDILPDAVKIGMVPSVEAASAIAAALAQFNFRIIVLDPVMVATAGQSLSGNGVHATLLRALAGTDIILTPNLIEAQALARMYGFEAMPPIAELARALHVRWLLIKGGHGDGDTLTDTLHDSLTGSTFQFSHPCINTRNTHGTGCSLSSAIASHIALGYDVKEAVERAINWLSRAIAEGAAYTTGHGHGPVNHLFNIKPYDSDN